MVYKALYRAYRPTNFEGIVGQKHIVTTLQNALVKNKLAHAYLFCGVRGTGKTSVAKLLAKAANCEDQEQIICNRCENCLAANKGTHADIVEIDAASNNGVDEIRSLIERVKYAPIQGKYKIYIIDEVHMLSLGAFNALLKTLEEPPEHIIFILATTEPHKVITTIMSRCQRFDFVKIKKNELKEIIVDILIKEKIGAEAEAIDLICDLADGGVRDALSIVDQCISYAEEKITLNDVNEIYGVVTTKEKLELLNKVFLGQVDLLLSEVSQYIEKGADIKRLTTDLIEIIKELVIYAYTNEKKLLVKIPERFAQETTETIKTKQLLEIVDILVEANNQYKTSLNVTLYFELCLLKMVKIAQTENKTSEKSIKKEKAIQEDKQKEDKSTSDYEAKNQEKAQEEPKETTTKKEATPPIIEDGYILGLLVGANKEKRAELNNKWKTINSYLHDIEYAAEAQKLSNSKIVAAGEGYIIVSAPYQALANDINEQANNDKNKKFTYSVFDEQLEVIAIEQSEWKRIIDLFIIKGKDNTLPEAIKIKQEAPIENKKNQTISDKMEELFGTGMFTVEE